VVCTQARLVLCAEGVGGGGAVNEAEQAEGGVLSDVKRFDGHMQVGGVTY
jgi:hypothetical protein